MILLLFFCAGYLAIIFEKFLKVNKAAIALLIATLSWGFFFLASDLPFTTKVHQFNEHFQDAAQIIIFLLGAMVIVELIDAHKGFEIITRKIATDSYKKLLLLITLITFFLSAVLDNLATTIVMISLVRRLIPVPHERQTLCCMIVVAANAGGAWTPIGDVTTTMLWIEGQVSTGPLLQYLFLPSLVSMLIPLGYLIGRAKGKITQASLPTNQREKYSAGIFLLGLASLLMVPVLKALVGLPPFMGILLGVGMLWLVTDCLHRQEEKKQHLCLPHVLTQIDLSSVLFFLGILLAVSALDVAGILQTFARLLETLVASSAMKAAILGLISAFIDNVPLVAASMGMYPLEQYAPDSCLWHLIAYAAGTGGSLLIIGSAAGVAMMSIEKIDFITYAKKITTPVFIGYIAGIMTYLFIRSC